ncbi:Ferredoxin--nitrite reductase, chloroplastic [Zea mays]|uniref:Ferredoxin--nitrite reductase, chloroplastic n=1 Tax=Zea mays TaxID=4577 RepID=A0A3L6FI42_MAIZE|nr:Ferredoxin--nitrite reductase, chloroplastic [Zea mays]
MEEIDAAKLTKDNVDVRLKWLGLFHRYKHQCTPTDSTPPAMVVVAVGRSDPASVTQTKQPSVPGVLAFLVHGFIAQVKMSAFYITYYMCMEKHVEGPSILERFQTTYLVSRFFMALTLKDQSILVNGDINEGLLRLCHKLHRLRKEYAYTFESTSLSYQCSERFVGHNLYYMKIMGVSPKFTFSAIYRFMFMRLSSFHFNANPAGQHHVTKQRKRTRVIGKKKRIAKKSEAAEYQKLLAQRLKEQRDRESLAKRRSKLSAASKASAATTA